MSIDIALPYPPEEVWRRLSSAFTGSLPSLPARAFWAMGKLTMASLAPAGRRRGVELYGSHDGTHVTIVGIGPYDVWGTGVRTDFEGILEAVPGGARLSGKVLEKVPTPFAVVWLGIWGFALAVCVYDIVIGYLPLADGLTACAIATVGLAGSAAIFRFVDRTARSAKLRLIEAIENAIR